MGLFGKKKSEESSSDSARDVGSLSVIALANDGVALESIFTPLIQYQHKTKLAQDVSSFIKILADFEPDIILVSLNLKNTDIFKVISVLQNLELPVIVFGEQEDEETCLKLLSTDLRHVIIPPLTFESFMERVEFLAMEKELLPEEKAGAPQNKNDWGKVIQLIHEKLSLNGGVIIEERLAGEEKSAGLHPLHEANRDELIQIDDGDLQIGKKLDVDIFIMMPLNHKCILYLRRGCILLRENRERLERYGKSRVMKKKIAA